MDLLRGDLHNDAVIALLQEHLDSLASTAPPESRHALNLDELRAPEISFWCLWDEDRLAGFGALKCLDKTSGEIKSMRTASDYLRRGVASTILQHLIAQAKTLGLSRLFLETGSMAFFEPARAFYAEHHFRGCPPFGDYVLDPNSVFMCLEISNDDR